MHVSSVTQHHATLDSADLALISEEERILAEVKDEILRSSEDRLKELEGYRKTFEGMREEVRSINPQGNVLESDIPLYVQGMELQYRLANRQRTAALPSKESPYFARMVLDQNGKRKNILLGYCSFLSTRIDFPVIDWRHAPLAKIFFLFREGDEYEQRLPKGMVEGTMILRHAVTIEHGELSQIRTASALYLRGRDGWEKVSSGQLGALGGRSARTHQEAQKAQITSLLDRDQYQALSEDPFDPLLITGSAGSGKTTVASHRLAALNFSDPKRFRPNSMSVVVPEIGVSRLYRNLTHSLGIDGVRIETFDEWAVRVGKRVCKLEGRRIEMEAPGSIAHIKRHPAMQQAIEAFCQHCFQEDPTWAERDSDLADHENLLAGEEHLETIAKLDESGRVDKQALKSLISRTRQQHTAKVDYSGYDEDRVKALDGEDLDWNTPDSLHESLDLEDLPILLEIRRQKAILGKKSNMGRMPRASHLLIDETQELANIELSGLGETLQRPASITVAGDLSQLTREGHHRTWEEITSSLRLTDVRQSHFTINYRCPRPIAELGQKVLGPMADPNLKIQLEGAPVSRSLHGNFANASIEIADRLDELILQEPTSRIAVICRTEDRAKLYHQHLSIGIDARLVLDGEFTFKPGVDVSTVEQVKGLEFDYVVIPDADRYTYPEDDLSRRTLYVAMTRATYQLWLLATGRWSDLV